MTTGQKRISKLVELSQIGKDKKQEFAVPASEFVKQEPEQTVHFVERSNSPERLVCEAEIHFHSGFLAGMKLVGFSLWKSPEGEIYVTFPSRAFGVASERRFYEFLRSIEGTAETVKRVKAAILAAYRKQR